MQMIFLRAVCGILVLSACTTGCGAGGSTSSGSGGPGTTNGTTSGGGNTTTATGGIGGAGGTVTTTEGGAGGSITGSGGSTSTGGPVYGYCTRPCGTLIDCCPPGSPAACPGNMYPYNYQCNSGICYAPECSSTADCTKIGPDLDCFNLSDFHACGEGCLLDGDCGAAQTCTGVDDDGKKYCELPSGGCTDDVACSGLGKCVNKVCVCENNADCSKPGLTKCAL